MMRFHREVTIPRLFELAGGALLGIVLLSAAAAATEVKFPESAPRITLQVPDGWAAAPDAHGLVLTSPEKDAYVLAGIVDGNEKAVEAWAKDARAKLVAAGTTFDRSKPTRTLVAKAAPNQMTTAPNSPAIAPNTFTGAPTIGQNFGGSTSAIPGVPAQPKTPAPPAGAALLAFKVVQMSGSTLNGKPVDVEISLYRIGAGQFALLEQVSGPVDQRGVDIEHTLKVLN